VIKKGHHPSARAVSPCLVDYVGNQFMDRLARGTATRAPASARRRVHLFSNPPTHQQRGGGGGNNNFFFFNRKRRGKKTPAGRVRPPFAAGPGPGALGRHLLLRTLRPLASGMAPQAPGSTGFPLSGSKQGSRMAAASAPGFSNGPRVSVGPSGRAGSGRCRFSGDRSPRPSSVSRGSGAAMLAIRSGGPAARDRGNGAATRHVDSVLAAAPVACPGFRAPRLRLPGSPASAARLAPHLARPSVVRPVGCRHLRWREGAFPPRRRHLVFDTVRRPFSGGVGGSELRGGFGRSSCRPPLWW